MSVNCLDRFVLTVSDINRTLAFYDRFASIAPITSTQQCV